MTPPSKRSMTPDRWWEVECGRLRNRRQADDRTAIGLAQRIGTDPRTLLRWEAGTSTPSVVEWLEWRQALGMSVAPNLAQDNPHA